MTKGKKRFSYATEQPAELPPAVEATATAVPAVPAPAQPIASGGSAADALANPRTYALPPQHKGWRDGKGSGELRRTDVPRKQVNVRLRPELKRAAAGLAGLRGMTIGDVIEAALIAYLEAARGDS